jgi:serine/threonine protein phosphatase 1
MGRIIAVGDIHGCIATLKQLMYNIDPSVDDTIIFLGDYIDRGTNSKGVIDYIIELKEQRFNIICLRGNHEQLFMESITDKNIENDWLRNGGLNTLESFSVLSYAELPSLYKEFLCSTIHYYKIDKFVFVHAGLNLNVENPFLDLEYMLWGRKKNQDWHKLNGHIVIHGHTPYNVDYILQQNRDFCINIDGGCVFKNYPGLGNLFAIDLTNNIFYRQVNID